ncbi:MAG TPA: phosphatase PAP2 family protein [Symbiobacteriaceae bacterium]|nr:phosphatase PAP2 family protein [Symbiobacteriaceae bacterium]
MDFQLFRWINGLAGHWPWLDLCMVMLAEWVMRSTPLLLAGLWFFPGPGRQGRRIAAVLTGLAVLISLGLTDLPSILYHRPRPFEVSSVTVLVRNPPPLPSFPSAHVAVVAAFAGAMGRRLGRWSAAAWALVGASMFARVFIGVHYPTDVLGGLVTGWVAGAVVYHNRDALHAFALRIVAMGEELL